jgi:hypothetical protein
MPAAAAIATRHRSGCVEPTRLAVRISEATAAVPDESAAITAEVAFVSGAAQVGPVELQIAVDAAGDLAHLDTALRNTTRSPARVESVVLGFRWSGHGAGSLRFLRHGWQSWSTTGSRVLDPGGEPPFPSGPWLRGMHHAVGGPPADRAGWHESDLVTVIGASPAGATCLVGVLERGRAFGVVHARCDADAVLIEVELRLDAELAPGETRDLERVRIALGDDASSLLEEFAEAHGRLAGARASAPFVAGWCSWYHFFHDVTEADVLRNLEALAAARDELPVEFVQIDDGYQRATGDWLETNAKFPRGLEPLAAEIRAAGFTPGLWTAPFCVVEASALFREHRPWLLQRGGEPFRGLVHPGWAPDGSVFVLDPSRSEVTAHLESLFARLVELGFDYLKLDFLYTAALQAEAADPRLGRAGRLRRGLEAVRAGAGQEAFLLGCGCPLGAAVGVVDGMRIGPDVAPTWRHAQHPGAGLDAPAPLAQRPRLPAGARRCGARRTGDADAGSRHRRHRWRDRRIGRRAPAPGRAQGPGATDPGGGPTDGWPRPARRRAGVGPAGGGPGRSGGRRERRAHDLRPDQRLGRYAGVGVRPGEAGPRTPGRTARTAAGHAAAHRRCGRPARARAGAA